MRSFTMAYLLCGASVSGSLLASAPAQAQAAYAFTLSVQPLELSLKAVGSRTGTNIVFDTRIVRGKMAPVLRGFYDARGAVEKLLDGSGLSMRQTDGGTIIVKQARTIEAGSAETMSAVGEDAASSGEIVVTGTRLTTGPVGAPVTAFHREKMVNSGATTLDQFFRTVPLNFSSLDPSTGIALPSAGGAGQGQAGLNTGYGATLNLHGIGVGATLTLLNGHRMAPTGNQGKIVDVSAIPIAAIDRVEILTDGASAVYGSDAVAGVVNIILRRDFNGAESGLRYGFTQDGGGREISASQLFGKSWSSGGVMASYSFTDIQRIAAADRSYVSTSPPSVIAPSFSIVPSQRQHSAIVNAHQSFGKLETKFDFLYGNRTAGFNTANTFVVIDGSSNTEQVGASVSGEYKLGFTSSIEVQGSYFITALKQLSTTTFTPAFIIDNTNRWRSENLSADARLRTRPLTLPAGDVELALGGGYRREVYRFINAVSGAISSSLRQGAQRSVVSAYAEMSIPLIQGETEQAKPRAIMSIAGRIDRYDGFGTTANPRLGAQWQISRDLRVRGTLGTSFRAPDPAEIIDLPENIYYVDANTNTSAGTRAGLVRLSSTNKSLKPERSQAFTLGIDYQPEGSSFRASLSYFNVRYKDRIQAPTITGAFEDVLLRPELSSLIDTSRDFAYLDPAVMRAQSSGTFNDPSGRFVSLSSIDFVADARLQNLARTVNSGFDFEGAFSRPLWGGSASATILGTYLVDVKRQLTATSSDEQLVNTIYNPARFRTRGSLAWQRGDILAQFTANYTTSYVNDLVVPNQRVNSLTTLDALLSYGSVDEGRTTLLRGWRLMLVIRNILNTRPPRVAPPIPLVDIGFDPANASPVGRAISISLSKKW